MNVQNILVPIDFSKCSKNALRIAIQIAKKNRAKIHMVNAIHVHTPHPDLAAGSLIENIISDYESQVQLSFDELDSEVVELKDVPHEADRFLSYVTDAILSEIESKSIDLIVMGTRDHHKKIDHLVGTNATDVIEAANIPVLVIPENCTTFEPKKIGLAADLIKVNGVQSFDHIKWMAQQYGSEVLAFHVTEDATKLEPTAERQISSITEALKGIESSVRSVESEALLQGINEFIDNHKLDVLTLYPRKHNLFNKLFGKSITKSVAVDPNIPIFTFHDD
jgi:nucleotide-binding universal stress UspA family protein